MIHQQKPDTTKILSSLKDFQINTVDYVYRRLYEDPDHVNHFLIADEVGLGKTLVAKGIIAKAVEHLWDKNDKITIVYICSNQDIAHQNINKLNIFEAKERFHASRITLLPLTIKDSDEKKVNFLSFTPGTSFNFYSNNGIVEERALIYRILSELDEISLIGLNKLLQGRVSQESWKWHINRLSSDKIESTFAQKYINFVQKNKEMERLVSITKKLAKSNIKNDYSSEKRQLIATLRHILAESIIETINPDIVIMDEFQRFKNLIDINNEENETARLARLLFKSGNKDSKILLLSATPYKMYTMNHEKEYDDHHKDLLLTTRFLFDSKEANEAFETNLHRYRKELFLSTRNEFSGLNEIKNIIESKLRRVMVRTERTCFSFDRNAMVEKSERDNLTLQSKDLESFKFIDNIAQILDHRDTVEYWKSAPYLLNFMDSNNYKMKRKLIEKLKDPYTNSELYCTLSSGKKHLLSWRDINSYKPIDPNNPKLQALMDHTIKNGAWKLLWVPPSLPYYKIKGPFTEVEHFTKSLIFSSWHFVPKSIAALCSYEAERLILESSEGSKDIKYSSKSKKVRPLLMFALRNNHPRSMSIFTLIYPCMTLASKISPFEMCVEMANSDIPIFKKVHSSIKKKIKELMKPILKNYSKSEVSNDERWYWASMALLDAYYYQQQIDEWLCMEGQEWFNEHYIDMFCKYFKGEEKLGFPPNDLYDVLAKIALASPAIVGLRSLMRQTQQKNDINLLSGSSEIAHGFVSMFNLPDSINIVRGQKRDNESYWKDVLDYCIKGNLQSVMDEYLHILNEELGIMEESSDTKINELSKRVKTAISIRTVILEVDEISMNSSEISKSRRMRCRFALRFGDGKNEESIGDILEEDSKDTRADHVRKAFNSPFAPFILASTSIGQEGLDFHQYCHDIYHWNLPANPVDLEQREGRIHRYKGHVIRKNISKKYPLNCLFDEIDNNSDPWDVLFRFASDDKSSEYNDMVPFWIYEIENGFKINRHILSLPLSRDEQHLENLQKSLAVYRMVFGQPRQEDLVKCLTSSLDDNELNSEELLKYQIDLSPM